MPDCTCVLTPAHVGTMHILLLFTIWWQETWYWFTFLMFINVNVTVINKKTVLCIRLLNRCLNRCLNIKWFYCLHSKINNSTSVREKDVVALSFYKGTLLFQIVCCIQKKKKIPVGLTGFYGVLVTTVTDGVMCTFIDVRIFLQKRYNFLILRKSVVPGAELNLRPQWKRGTWTISI